MAGETPELTDLGTALTRFAFSTGRVEGSEHIRRLHWYTACRLVIEGGFRPEFISPRPPFHVEKRGSKFLLHHDPSCAHGSERTILGGLKTKKIDITVINPRVGPVVAVSLKGTRNAFRNLTNRMEEAAGDCTNLHMAYPALVYAFWHVLRANEEDDPAPQPPDLFKLGGGRFLPADLAIMARGGLAEQVERYALAVERLSDREDLRDYPSKYEACGLTMVKCRGGLEECGVHALFPLPGTVLDFNRMFDRIYAMYDRRFVYQAPALQRRTSRLSWDPESPILRDTILPGGAFVEMKPRLG